MSSFKRNRKANTVQAAVIRNKDIPVSLTSWGSLQWLVSGQTVSGTTMTLGRVTFKPGESNSSHSHPNCEEILYVAQGTIEHSLPQGGTVCLKQGDCIVMPQGSFHNAKNIGTDETIVIVAFNSPDRKTDTDAE
ncbi:MAG: cupin domain-containing protein [Candidatus Omnitrophica bacterium]|nr:cupin domain-containing protein [Candidatus Omnitrophota bacterium]